ncbi:MULTISPECIES: oligosaccharide flippase family protein [unclassified Vibrio]|uniref:oligosaccharide flippase family protein n=1 Tax=unclassified Vibrio TaxID=2614977 RepID=UPI00296485FA|nr:MULTISPECIES: oligosaccharide flippase family protein [unclassified Vibrio]MDW1579751.1 oligosaccharide flippase family protein [Vibrio sp. Vb2897]MDW1585906.1 oligosaccharide flippase family protein [Vibrio sp. Vb2910]MDW1594797.1 oligosaccharide flippase family protein [Vibrio sp. Vb2911]MDW1638012.1 oligosaccharide flippase family protein [Vibrio sp. Vb2896]MDW1648315.1 oligosaccharide flippase family protein [Vibrio sp. Vb2912]
MNKFFTNILFLLSGTAGAQLIGFLSMPIITRQYGPEAFGILGFVMAITNVINPISSLTLPSSIVIADEKEIKNIDALSRVISILMTILTLLLCSIYVHFYRQEDYYLYFIFVSVYFSTIYQIEQNKIIRHGDFKKISKSFIASSFIINASKILFAFIYPEAFVLVLISILTPMIQSFFIVDGYKKVIFHFNGFQKNTPLKVLKKYKNFPLYKSPQVLLNAMTQSLPVIILASKFGVVFSGYYSLARMVIGVPINLINKSVGDVFYSKLSELKRCNKKIFPEIKRVTVLLFLIMSIPFFVFSQIAPDIFIIVFGEKWEISGTYSAWMSLWLLFALINRPSVMAIQVLGLQKQYLFYETITMFIRVAIFYYISVVFEDPLFAVQSFSVISCVINILLICWVFSKAINHDKY